MEYIRETMKEQKSTLDKCIKTVTEANEKRDNQKQISLHDNASLEEMSFSLRED